MFFLVNSKSKDKIILDKESFSIGSFPDSDFKISTPETLAIFKQHDKEIMIYKGIGNIKVNKKHVLKANLNPNDEIIIGNESFIFSQELKADFITTQFIRLEEKIPFMRDMSNTMLVPEFIFLNEKLAQTFSLLNDNIDLMEMIISTSMKYTSSQKGFLLIKDKEKNKYMIQVPTNFASDEISNYEKITNLVINPCIKNIKGNNSDYFNNIKVPELNFISSVLVSKLKIRNVIIGYIFLFNKEDNRKFEDKDKYILEIVSTHSSLAFERISTLEKIKEDNENILKLQRYLPRKAISKLLNENVEISMNGNVQTCTVLLSDITEFMKISKNLSPVQLVSLLNDYFTIMTKIIFSFNGTISKFIGDKILAVFGLPLPSANHYLEAVLASLEMKRQEKILKEKIKEKYQIDDFNIRIGINTGPVLYGNVGAPQRMEFTVMGATVNITNKVTEMAKPDNIFITGTTYEKVKGIIRSNFINKLKRKSNQDIEVYQIFDKTDSELFVKLEDKNITYNVREHVRIEIRAMVIIAKDDLRAQGTIKDISLGGVSIKTNTEFKKGDEINLSFKLSNDIFFENIPAVIRHVNPAYKSKDSKSTLGVQFTKLSDEEYINLVNYIDKKIF